MSRGARRRDPALTVMKQELQRWSYVDRERSPAATVVLAGSGRSGTTWLGEIIDRHHDHRVIFEPLKANAVPLARPFVHGHYLRPGDTDPRYREPIERILTGRIRNRWTDHQNHVRWTRRRLVKDVRANNLLPWLHDAFPEVPLVYLVRHPVAVAVSTRALGWRDQLDGMLAQPALVADHLEPARPLLRSLATPWERRIGQWCAENLVPLRMLGPGAACLVFYEDLCDHPQTTATRVLAHLGQVADAALDAALDRPSRLVRPHSAVTRQADPVESWLDEVSPGELERAAEIVAACGLGDVWGTDPRPVTAAGYDRFACPWNAADP